MQDFIPYKSDTIGTEVILTDKRDGNTYRCIKMADGRWWMGENLKYNITGSTFYDNDPANLEKYGRLYNWQDARNATPENWSVPSDDDWKKLEIALGMTQADADAATVWRNSGNVGSQLKESGNSGIDLLMGGYQHTGGSYLNLGIYGRYWTSTESGATAWDRDVYSNKTGVYRGTFSKAYRYSVRCILQVKETIQYMQEFVPNPADPVGTEIMLTDKRDGIIYRCLKMADGRWWMGENLKFNIEGSTFYDNDTTYSEGYGRLYKWQEAMDAVPENWNLANDYEWRTLEMALGMSFSDANADGVRINGNVGTQLNARGNSGFNALFGGMQYPSGSFPIYRQTGAFWTSSEYSLSNAWQRTIFPTSEGVGRSSNYSKAYRYSVRCILKEKKEPLYMQDFVPSGNEPVNTEIMLTDKRDGITYRCIKMADGRWWMGENLKYDQPGSVTYNNDPTNSNFSGRLYNWQNIQSTAPNNWSVPSDDEWKTLEIALGMTQEDADKEGARGSSTFSDQLGENGSSGINLQFGGFEENGNFSLMGSYGRYWTSTEYNSNMSDAWMREVNNNNVSGVRRTVIDKSIRYSIRCIKNL